jgi:hypothetical protein
MNPYATPQSAVGHVDEGDHREAPAAVLTACKAQINWQLTLTILLLAVALTLTRVAFLMIDYVRLINELARREVTAGQSWLSIFCWTLVALTIASAAASFRCFRSLRAFSRDRRVVVLHRAMRRLRMLWRVFTITFLLTISGLSLPALIELLEMAQ